MIELVIIPDIHDSEQFLIYKDEWHNGRKVARYLVATIHGDMLGHNVPYVEAMNGKGREARFTLTPKV